MTNLINHQRHKNIMDAAFSKAISSSCAARHSAILILKDGRWFEKCKQRDGIR